MARIDPPACLQLNEHGLVARETLGLRDHGLLPDQPQPMQIFAKGRHEFGAATVPIEIIVAEKQDPSGGARTRAKKRTCMAEVKVPGGRRSQTAHVCSVAGGRAHDFASKSDREAFGKTLIFSG